MTRRRFNHCQNKACNRRLEELPKQLTENDPPPPSRQEFCEGCLAMLAKGPGPKYFAMGRREGFAWGAGLTAVLAVAVWTILRIAVWIAAAPPA